MKNFIIIFLMLATIAGCGQIDPVSASKKNRYTTMPEPGRDDRQEQEAAPGSRSLFYVAVIVPDGYDWHRDSASGSPEAQIKLYKDFKLIKSISCGPEKHISTDPDSHHLEGGKLYTEYSIGNRTFIKRDGEALWDYEGREFLKGILVDGEEIWTVSQQRSGQGFSLRKNGRPVFQKEAGVVFGDLSASPRGALYIDEGEICFCYKNEDSSGQTLYSVRNAEERFERLVPGNVLDFRQYKRKNYILYLPSGKKRGVMVVDDKIVLPCGTRDDLVNGYFVDIGDKIYLAGSFDKEIFYGEQSRLLTLPANTAGTIYAYPEKTGIATVIVSGDEVRIESKSGLKKFSGAYHFFSGACACFDGASRCIALTPRDGSPKKLICLDEQTTELDFNGFLTCVELFTTQ